MKFFVLLSCMAAVITVQLQSELWLTCALMPVSAFFATAGVMLGHEGGHGALSTSARRNSIFYHMAFPLFAGLGANFWRWKHNQEHHGHPNVEGRDPDIALWPMTTSQNTYEECGPARRWFQRHLQGKAFWPLTTFMPQLLRIKTTRFLIGKLRAEGLSRGFVADAACFLGHFTLWMVMPVLLLGASVGSVVLFWFGFWSCVGFMLAMVFAPAHMGLDIVRSHDDPWLLQLETTRNLVMPRWLSFFFIGLDYQVEHHLFPKIPHQNLPKAAEVTKAWAAREGVPYQEIGYFASLVDVTRFMHDAWRRPARIDTPEAAPLPAAE